MFTSYHGKKCKEYIAPKGSKRRHLENLKCKQHVRFTLICNRRHLPTQGTSSTLSSPSNWHHLIPALWRVEGSVLEDPGNGFRRKMQPEYRARAATTSQKESTTFQNTGMICCLLLVARIRKQRNQKTNRTWKEAGALIIKTHLQNHPW